MGLFGLSVFLSRMRTKEIGIRKILGSSVWQILSLLGRQYIQWVAIANLLAWPAAWYLMSTWLQSYPYRIPLQPAIFIGAGCLTIVIAAATISVHILHTARQNPINSIRYE
jgi:putative ABC transport system permease protein